MLVKSTSIWFSSSLREITCVVSHLQRFMESCILNLLFLMPYMSPVTQLLFAYRLTMELTLLNATAQCIWLCIFSDYLRKNIWTHTSIHLGRHQGMVSNVIGGTLCIQLDNGRSENVELGKQAIRLIASRSKGGKRWNLSHMQLRTCSHSTHRHDYGR